MKRLPPLVKSIFAALATVAICLGLLTLTAMIPKKAMMNKWLESGDYFASHGLFDRFIGDTLRTMQDNFSDINIYNIMLFTDEEKPFTSSLEARFYQPDYARINEAYEEALHLNPLPEANKEYARYWHGTMVYLRPLSLFMNIVQIRILMGIIIVACFIACSILLIKKKMYAETVVIWLAWFFLQGWMLFTSLEYSTAFLWTAIFTLYAVCRADSREADNWTGLFIVAGIVTAFVDFLTTETLTLTMPLLLLWLIYRKSGKLERIRKEVKSTWNFLWKICFKYVLAWGAAYGGMYAFKWLLIYLVMGREVFDSSISEGLFRVGGTVYLGNSNLFDEATTLQQYQGAVWHNLAMLFPFNSEISFYTTCLCFLGVCLVILIPVYLFREKIDWKFFGLASIAGIIPILRYLLLSNHAYVHFFFTYRAMYPTLMVAFLFFWENGIPRLKRSKKK